MLTCKEVAKLASESLDRPLPWRKRLAVWSHHYACYLCRRYAKQLKLLRGACRCIGSEEEPPIEPAGAPLPDDAKDRIKRALAEPPSSSIDIQ